MSEIAGPAALCPCQVTLSAHMRAMRMFTGVSPLPALSPLIQRVNTQPLVSAIINAEPFCLDHDCICSWGTYHDVCVSYQTPVN